uniref:Secreted frizzled related protein 3 n=1 Tax=Schmidtea mediterranea TaxID=79327 RepID=E3UZJ5_SCHMD|nr:secreted frizzled related protein 3 [Schmidtea mediterranea]
MRLIGSLLVLLVLVSLFSVDFRVGANRQRLNQCYPKFANHTLCGGAGVLNSMKTFSGLLRNSKSGFSIYQSNIWIILLHTKCHVDLEKFLCTIYAPICLKGHRFTRVFPCEELCASVKEQCLPRLKIYGFEWPSIVDCGKFPLENKASCIQLTDGTGNYLKKSLVKKQREDRSLNQTILSDQEQTLQKKNCPICNRKVPLEILTKNFCKYSLVIRAKIANIFQKPKGAISIRLQHKSNIIHSSHPIRISLANLITEIQCKCSILQNAKSVSKGKWLLFGDIENGQFIVKFLTKWQRKRKKFRSLFRQLMKKPKFFCKNRNKLLNIVNNQFKPNENLIQKSETKTENNQPEYSIYSNPFIYKNDLKKFSDK